MVWRPTRQPISSADSAHGRGGSADGPGDGIDEPSIDSESAALFRAWLCPLIDQAESWNNLTQSLAERGYALAIRNGRLVLLHQNEPGPVCSLRFFGTSLRELAQRLGRPTVRPIPGMDASGDFPAE